MPLNKRSEKLINPCKTCLIIMTCKEDCLQKEIFKTKNDNDKYQILASKTLSRLTHLRHNNLITA